MVLKIGEELLKFEMGLGEKIVDFRLYIYPWWLLHKTIDIHKKGLLPLMPTGPKIPYFIFYTKA